MRRITVLLSVLLLMLAMTGTAAVADTPLWDDEDVLDQDDETTPVGLDEEPEPTPEPQEASITLTGPDSLEVDEQGTYTVEVTNESGERVLDEWVLGLSVTNVSDLDDLSIRYESGGDDITEGTSGVDVELDTDANIIYLRGSDDPSIPANQSDSFTFEAEFHKVGSFTGTAYVINEDPFRGVDEEMVEFLPYYNADGGTDEDVPPPTKPLSDDGSSFESGAEYEFEFCTLDRTRWELDGTRVLSFNNQKCYNDGEVEYQHRALLMSENHPDFEKYEDAGHATGFGGAWLMLSFEVVVPDGIDVNVKDFEDITTWASFGDEG